MPYLLFVNPYGRSLGTWTKALKELAFSGSSFVVAGSYSGQNIQPGSALMNLLKKIIPFGRVFFSITMIVFGIDHFLYTDYVAPLVPAWIPGHNFWTYFAGVALIGSGVAIILRIKMKLVAALLGTMIFLWFIFLHIPRAIADPYGSRGNEMTSVFQSFGFSGIAFIIAFGRIPPIWSVNQKPS
jgi:DMSO reductase anchor subunit